jgi:hypothetical protein
MWARAGLVVSAAPAFFLYLGRIVEWVWKAGGGWVNLPRGPVPLKVSLEHVENNLPGQVVLLLLRAVCCTLNSLF